MSGLSCPDAPPAPIPCGIPIICGAWRPVGPTASPQPHCRPECSEALVSYDSRQRDRRLSHGSLGPHRRTGLRRGGEGGVVLAAPTGSTRSAAAGTRPSPQPLFVAQHSIFRFFSEHIFLNLTESVRCYVELILFI